MNSLTIDVREPEEFASGHVDGAINLPLSSLIGSVPELGSVPKDTKIVLYCRSGARANVAMAALKQQGFTNITNGINQEQLEAGPN